MNTATQKRIKNGKKRLQKRRSSLRRQYAKVADMQPTDMQNKPTKQSKTKPPNKPNQTTVRLIVS